MLEKKKSNELCVRTVTVITCNNLVITGHIKRDNKRDDRHDHEAKPKDEGKFITIKLTTPLLVIPGSGGSAQVQPFYAVGDTVRINEDQIVTIGPSHING